MDFFDPQTLFTTESFVALLTLLVLEIVLGIDNVIFLTILADRLPEHQQSTARRLGLSLAVVGRVLLLLAISAVIRLDETTLIWRLTGKDIILLIGGLFLIGKSTYEIHHKLEDAEETGTKVQQAAATLSGVLVQVLLIDLVFSLDSVITAVGITDQFPVMVIAILTAAGIMIAFAEAIGEFVKRHPTMKMLALSFLILIGSLLVVEGWNPEAAEELHLKNYIYFAMAFSFGVELLNMRFRRAKREPVQLHNQPSMKTQPAVQKEIEAPG
jgi:predicted tellurium resistance membrane protein TerC